MPDGKMESLVTDLNDEIESATQYMSYAADSNDRSEQEILRAIAKDEYTHASYLHEFLEDNGVTIPTDVENKYKELVGGSWKFC